MSTVVDILKKEAKPLSEIQIFQCPPNHWIVPDSVYDNELKTLYVKLDRVLELIKEDYQI